MLLAMPALTILGVERRVADRLASSSPSSSHPPIRTPQALLARDPAAVAERLSIPLPAALNLRAAVADALTGRGRVGGDAARVVAEVSRSLLEVGGDGEGYASRRWALDDEGGAE